MNESSFQALYKKYHSASPGSQARKEVVGEMHYYIYQYGMKRFGADQDTASDFYMKINARIESLFNEYDSKYNISFTVYLAVILKRNYLKFFSNIQRKENIYCDFVHENPEIKWDPPDESINQESENISDIRNNILSAIDSLDLGKQIVLRLHFGFYLLLSHLRILAERHGGVNFFHYYRTYIQKIKEWRLEEISQKKRVIEKLEKMYHRSDKNQSRHESLIDEFYKVKSPVTLRFISQFVKKSTSQVHRLIQLGKKELKQLFFDRYREIPRSLGIIQGEAP